MSGAQGQKRDLIVAHPRFKAYVGNARHGRSGVGRIVAAILLIVACWIVATIAVLLAGGLYLAAQRHGMAGMLSHFLDDEILDDLFAGREGIVIVLLSNASVWIGVWLAISLVHRRRLSSVLGEKRNLPAPDFLRGACAALIVGALSVAVAFAIDPGVARTGVAFAPWLAALLPLVLLLLLQSSAEEVLFRGYLHQTLAARFRHPVVWALLPTFLFVLLHWYTDAIPVMNAALLANMAAFSVAMTVLVLRSGNLAACIGAHFGNNVLALLFFTVDPDARSVALFEGRLITDPGWTVHDAVLTALGGVVSFGVLLALLLHRASPLRLKAA